MEPVFAVLTGIFLAVAVYLLLSKFIIRMLLGIAILGNAVNLLIFTSGRIMREVPPVIGAGLDVPAGATANPLPQALILTAIVISFSFFAFLLVLSWRAYSVLERTTPMVCAWPSRTTSSRRRLDTDRYGRFHVSRRSFRGPGSSTGGGARLAGDPAGRLVHRRRRHPADDPSQKYGPAAGRGSRSCRSGRARCGPALACGWKWTGDHGHGPLAAAVRHRLHGRSHRRAVCTDIGRGGADWRHRCASTTSMPAAGATASTLS
jgi:multicomponent Na+:H+ antiporter subunit C